MSAQTMRDAFAPIMARYRSEIMAATWGHLAPRQRKSYSGYVLFAVPEYDCGTPCIIQADFKGLNDSPWLYDVMWDFASKTNVVGVYRFEGTFQNYEFKGITQRLATN